MGVTNIRIARSAGSSAAGSHIVATSSASPASAVISWNVMYGGSRSFTWAVDSVEVIAKGGGELTKLTRDTSHQPWGSFTSTGTKVGEDGYRYDIAVYSVLSSAGYAAVSVSWASRQYDLIRITFRVRPSEYPKGYTETGVLEVRYVPKPTGLVATIDGESLHVTTSMDGWNGEGEWHVSSVKDTGGTKCLSVPDMACSGSVTDGAGEFWIPLSALSRMPKVQYGRNMTVYCGLVPPYASADDCIAPITPTCSVESLDGTVSATSSRGDDGSVTLDVSYSDPDEVSFVAVKLDGGELPCDTASDELGQITMPMAPQGAHSYTVTAVALGDSTKTKSATVSVPAWGERAFRAMRAGTADVVVGRYNLECTLNESQDMETYQLSGRRRPSAFFGEAGESEWSVAYVVEPGDALGHGQQDEQLSRARGLSEGTCYAETPMGDRVMCAVSGLQVGRSYESGAASVSMTVTEVS